MTTLRAGDIVTGMFAGSRETKARPAVVVSSQTYHEHRPDVVICFLTTQIAGLNAPTDYVLHDWREAELSQPSAFRAFFVTTRASERTNAHRSFVGRRLERNWGTLAFGAGNLDLRVLPR